MMKLKHLKNQRGVTLVELLVVMAIMGIISTAIYNFLFVNYKIYKVEDNRMNIQHWGQMAINSFSEDFMEASEVLEINDDEFIKFKIEYDEKENPEKVNKTITYSLRNDLETKLKRLDRTEEKKENNVDKNYTSQVAYYIEGVEMIAYDLNGNEMMIVNDSNKGNISEIQIIFNMKKDTEEKTYSTRVKMRNKK